jgi:hypothetical protein
MDGWMDKCTDGEDLHPLSSTYSQKKKKRKKGKSKMPAKTINNNNNFS